MAVKEELKRFETSGYFIRRVTKWIHGLLQGAIVERIRNGVLRFKDLRREIDR